MPQSKERRKELTRAYKERPLAGGAYVIRNTVTGRQLLAAERDLGACQNRFCFMQATGSCPNCRLARDWAQYGPKAFQLEVLEELEAKDGQDAKDFQEDLALLEALWRDKLGPESLY